MQSCCYHSSLSRFSIIHRLRLELRISWLLRVSRCTSSYQEWDTSTASLLHLFNGNLHWPTRSQPLIRWEWVTFVPFLQGKWRYTIHCSISNFLDFWFIGRAQEKTGWNVDIWTVCFYAVFGLAYRLFCSCHINSNPNMVLMDHLWNYL